SELRGGERRDVRAFQGGQGRIRRSTMCNRHHRHEFADFVVGVHVKGFGVSGDGQESHTRFRERHNLPFPLIADPGREVHRLYEVTGLLPFITPRITYVIDAEGVIRAAIRHDLLVTQHIPDVLAALKQLGPAPEAS
ncbi:MAG TPA: redoxin domain-containing protein, partial [Tepidiformaceae bacterium]|nr:redoxin domain-containing protein [Tepidiformaceae bacterium]